MKFEELDGLVMELYNTCDNLDEWNIILTENLRLFRLKSIWEQWDSNHKGRIPKLEFTDDDINYLNSRFITDLVKSLNIDKYSYSCQNKEVGIFRNSCQIGNLDVVKYIFHRWGYWFNYINNNIYTCTDEKFVRMDTLNILTTTCFYGHLDVAKWLFAKFKFNDKNWYMLRTACMNGHLHVAKWLVESYYPQFKEEWDLCKIGVFTDIIEFVASCGYLPIAKWLVEQGADLHIHAHRTFVNASKYGSLEFMKWIVESNCKILENIQTAFMYACENGHFDIMEWLTQNYQIDVNHNNCICVRLAFEAKRGDVVKWLVDKFLSR